MTNKRDLKAYVRYDGTGKVSPGSLVLRRKKPKNGNWKEIQTYECCNPGQQQNNVISFDFNLETFYNNLGDDLEACNIVIRSAMTGVNLFYDDNDGGANLIGDGGNDMYDEGNCLNTNLTQLYADIKDGNVNPSLNIPYTHTQSNVYNSDYLYANPPIDGTIQSGDSYFGTGSSYFTNMYPGVFILAASGLTGVTEFSITGDVGTDGNAVTFYYKQPTSYVGWTAYCKSNRDTDPFGDPSVNHIILVKGPNSLTTQTGDFPGDWDDHVVQNLTDSNTDIIYILFSKLPGTNAPTKEDFRAIADATLSVAAGLNPCN